MASRLSLPSTFPEPEGPLVSVVVPTYEDAEYVGTAIESLAAQTHGDVEAIVVDSSGVEWLEALADDTDWVRYEYQEPAGLSAARNRGIDIAHGDYIGFLDADDEWLPAKLEHQLPLFGGGADVVYADAYIAQDGGKRRLSSLPISEPATHHVDFLHEGGVPIPTVLARRECFEEERFDESLPAVEDRHMLARLFRKFEPGRVAEPIVVYNRRDDSMSSDAEQMYEAELTVLESLFDRYGELADHRESLLANARYKYGKRLLRTGRDRAARRELLSLVRDGRIDLRTAALLLATVLPFSGQRTLWYLERIEERLA